jgi:hypothetical protein
MNLQQLETAKPGSVEICPGTREGCYGFTLQNAPYIRDGSG